MSTVHPTTQAIAEALIVGEEGTFETLPAEVRDRLLAKAEKVREALAAAAPTDEPVAANVWEALNRVMRDLPGIAKLSPEEHKRQRGAGGGAGERGITYSYRSIEQVTAETQHLFARHRVNLVPYVLNVPEPRVFTMGDRDTRWEDVKLEVLYWVIGPGGATAHIERLVREDGSLMVWIVYEGDCFVTGPYVAIGRDNSDKGNNKAITMAEKQCLLQLLQIGDPKDDPDNERHLDEGSRTPPTPDELAVGLGWDGQADQAEHARLLGALVDGVPGLRARFHEWRAGGHNAQVGWARLDSWTYAVDGAVWLAEHPDAPLEEALTAIKLRPKLPNSAEQRSRFLAWATEKLTAGKGDGEPADETGAADQPSPAPELVEQTSTEVLAMEPKDVDAALKERQLAAGGSVETRRQRLVKALVKERLQGSAAERAAAAEASLEAARKVYAGEPVDPAPDGPGEGPSAEDEEDRAAMLADEAAQREADRLDGLGGY